MRDGKREESDMKPPNKSSKINSREDHPPDGLWTFRPQSLDTKRSGNRKG